MTYILQNEKKINDCTFILPAYNEVKRIDTPGSLAYKAAEYRNHYVSLLANEIDEFGKC